MSATATAYIVTKRSPSQNVSSAFPSHRRTTPLHSAGDSLSLVQGAGWDAPVPQNAEPDAVLSSHLPGAGTVRTDVIDLGGTSTGTAIHHGRVGADNGIGAPGLFVRSSWLVRLALRAGTENGYDVQPTAGASLTFGRCYGGRSILHIKECGRAWTRFRMGGYVSLQLSPTKPQ